MANPLQSHMGSRIQCYCIMLFTSQLLLILTVPNHRQMARLRYRNLNGWLHAIAKMVYQSANGHPSKYQPDSALINFVHVNYHT